MKCFQTVSIIGLGLIGGSFALALKKSGYKGTVIGYDAAQSNLADALAAKAIDVAAASLDKSIIEAGLIVLAVPLGAYPIIFRELAQVAKGRRFVLSDVGSVKTYVQHLAEELLPDGAVFIGGHPMAGSERGGFAAARVELFQGACYFLTPVATQQQELVQALKEMVERLGALPVVVSPEEHDRVVAKVSHVPHLLAALLAGSLSSSEAPFVGSGFRDTTRIAAGNPHMWNDILMLNRGEILTVIESIESVLKSVKTTLHSEDPLGLTGFLQQAKNVRDGLPTGR